MKVELNDGWLGRVLNHPTNVCSLAWGITWRALLSVIGAAVALGFLSVWIFANYHLFGTVLFGMEGHYSIGFAIVFDIVITAWLFIFSDDWTPKIKPYLDPIIKKAKDKCPQVEWKELEQTNESDS